MARKAMNAKILTKAKTSKKAKVQRRRVDLLAGIINYYYY